jgi:hypothetical protein
MSGFVAGGIRPIGTEWIDEKGGVISATAVLALALPRPQEPDARRLQQIGFKIGLLVDAGQQVRSLSANGVAGAERPEVSADLAAVFGTPPGERWVGVVFPKPPPPPIFPYPDVAEYRLVLVLTGIKELPQLIPAPSRYGNEASFAESHLTALWVIRAPAGQP